MCNTLKKVRISEASSSTSVETSLHNDICGDCSGTILAVYNELLLYFVVL